MPRKEFESFTRLDASDVNTYLMDQSVMTFGGTAARGSAIATPVEGMVTYLEDSNSLQLWDGASWTSAGGVSSGNAIINGAFEINQRNFTSSTASVTIGHDRWRLITVGGTSTYSAETFTPGSAPVAGYEGSSFARLATTGQSGTDAQSRIYQRIEDVRTFAGQTVTLSFFAKSSSGTPTIAVGPTQSFGSGGSANVVHVQKIVLTGGTAWTRYTATFNLTSLTGKTIGAGSTLELNLWTSAGSALNALTDSLGAQTNTIDFWGVQLEAGPIATPFRRNANSLQGELAACQRYYIRYSGGQLYSGYGAGWSYSTTRGDTLLQLPVQMRSVPTALDYSNISFTDSSYTVYAISNLVIDAGYSGNLNVNVVATTNFLTANRPGRIQNNNNATGFVGLSAEL